MTGSFISAALRGSKLLPLLAANLVYGLALLLAALLFAVAVAPLAVLRDLVLFNLIAILLLACARRIWAWLLLVALLSAVFVLGSAAKIALLGRPIMPEDAHSVVALTRIMGPMGWVVVALPLGLMALLLIGNLKLDTRRAAFSLALLAAAPLSLAPVAEPALRLADRHIGNAPWDQRENFVGRGPATHMLQETLRAYALIQPPPDAEAVTAAIERLRQRAGAFSADLALLPAIPVGFDGDVYAAGQRRNVHILLLESFWDPTPLLDAETPILDPRFYALWDETGRSTALSPTFSGGTANAEFEVLCGFPVDSWAVKFELGFNAVPCLPAQLRDQGYRTIASHPNDAGFWNRVSAYPRLGFEHFWSKPDFVADEMISWMLSDRSLYRQIAEKIAADETAAPVLNFVVTLYGHWTYDMVPERPAILPIDPAQAELGQFATAMHYKSIELMDEIERLRRADPDALIIAFGDHLPNLGYNWGGYKNNGFFKGGWGDFPAEMYLRSRETPLIVIDGRNGPVAVGRQPLYRLNGLIRQRLHLTGPAIADLLPQPHGLTLRPVPDTLLGLDQAGTPFLCKPGESSGPCAIATDWLADVKLVAQDLFDGSGHALGALSAERYPVSAALR
ncbi:phosphoglycerol transferase MdoB-like AlkP superfamily enzyme [Dongia mobilis]|uniref:Phosphoglycerol transferase MdoB-like AlkP superfamily enzyme n=1 Tax=Dongia mobilis TaxID=578943 RepID=A0A4R6WQW5_9PROT|nr:LTA synthase family protein [Dongia mobilis]TDQ82186.1 phosphoglycerol transferase MdoB-like AlkP superfamily enzyme [Dongia mobilis]